MCGFVGSVNSDSAWIDRALADLHHRGPDDSRWYHCDNPSIHVGFNRLSIVDLANGAQPMSNENGTVWIVCNGEIFNSPELRKKLIERGHIFKTINSDVETLIHLYEDEGENVVNQLSGMYAFVVIDFKKNCLFGARDRIGIKPLYYRVDGSSFSFASEMKALMNSPGFRREIDPQSLYHYLSLQFIPAPDTVFKGIHRLSAGCCFTYKIDTNSLCVKKYWKLPVNPIMGISMEDWAIDIRQKMAESVKLWTLADVPIGCSLSGGIDSAALVGFLRQAGIEQLHTFTVGFSGNGMDEYNELDLARITSKHFDTIHEEFVVDSDNVLDDLEKMVWHLDEPYGGGLPSWYIYKAMQNKVKVCMTGSGGDELFGNYGKYRIYEKSWLYHMVKPVVNAIRHHAINEISDSLNYPHGYYSWKYIPDSIKRSVVFDRSFASALIPTEAFFENYWQQNKTVDCRDIIPIMDFDNQLPEEFLFMTDRFSMAHGIEARVPFLDHLLVEKVYSIPHAIRSGTSDPKAFEKRMLHSIIPSAILNAPKKGFRMPLREWTRGCLRPIIHDTFNPEVLKNQGIFSPLVYEKMIRPHLEGKIDRTEWVWTLFMFQLWYNKFVTQRWSF